MNDVPGADTIRSELILIRRVEPLGPGNPMHYSSMPGRGGKNYPIDLIKDRDQISRIDENNRTIAVSGEKIREKTEQNPDTSSLYDYLNDRSQEGNGRDCTIVFDIEDADDDIAWETLRLEYADFVSMSYGPVIRQVSIKGAKTEFPFLQPIKILVILSATPDPHGMPVSALSEWTKLEEVFTAADRRLTSEWILPLGARALHVVVMTNEDALFDRIHRAAESWIECGIIQSEPQLRAVKERFGPHMVHMFCHGEARETGKVCLWLGNQAAFQSGDADIEIAPGFFESSDNQPWLVTLNACSTAGGDRDRLDSEIRNFARLLLQKKIPAVLGMRERVRVDHAAAVAQNFYEAFLAQMASMRNTREARAIDFGAVMVAVRRRTYAVLHEDQEPPPESCAHWPIPILYVNSVGLRLVRQGPRTDRSREIVIALQQHAFDIGDYEAQIAELEAHQDRIRAHLTKALDRSRAQVRMLEDELRTIETVRGETVRGETVTYLKYEDKQIVRSIGTRETVVANTLVERRSDAGMIELVAATGELDLSKLHAAGKPPSLRPAPILGGDAIDRNDWLDPRVGWGLIVERDASIPACLNDLLAFRRARVFRYDRALTERDGRLFLLDEATGATPSAVSSEYGPEAGTLPRFLLIYGGPDVIPWSVQYQLNANRAVGRLHLEGAALERYVRCAIDNWSAESPAVHGSAAALVWATWHNRSDFTDASMRVVGKPLAEAFAGNGRASTALLFERATQTALVDALVSMSPGVIVTVSHGSTQPLGDAAALRAGLGLPIDNGLAPLDLAALFARWKPDGAIWYAHACCSAGADGTSGFVNLFEPDSSLRAVLTGLEVLGPCVAPLATALLSAEQPARAFIGHVEPTFDWSLRDPDNKALISRPFTRAFAENLLGENEPVGAALTPRFAELAARYTQYDLRQQANEPLKKFITDILVARDIQRTVIIGDPAVALPAHR